MSEQQTDSGILYKPSSGVRFVLGAGFLLFLLFNINAAAGAVWLAVHNLPGTAVVFALMFVFGALILLYLGIMLFAASHTEVWLNEANARMVLPNWRGPTPLFPYTEVEIPYRDIQAVETRGEIYHYFLMPTIMRAVSIVRKDGERFTLGYTRDEPTDPAVPFHDIAEEIAKRSGVSVNNRGFVEAGGRFRTMVQDEPPWDIPECSEDRVRKAKLRERFAWLAAGTVLLILIVGALVYQAIELYGHGATPSGG